MIIEEKEELQAVVNKYYENREIDLTPSYPYALVRVLPRSQLVRGRIWTPDKASKPIHEGIVLATFKPFWKQLRYNAKIHTTSEGEGEAEYTETMLVEAS